MKQSCKRLGCEGASRVMMEVVSSGDFSDSRSEFIQLGRSSRRAAPSCHNKVERVATLCNLREP
jgi:hypothetical protein